jgi:hypothetical protein
MGGQREKDTTIGAFLGQLTFCSPRGGVTQAISIVWWQWLTSELQIASLL